jgi:hypothetical protein
MVKVPDILGKGSVYIFCVCLSVLVLCFKVLSLSTTCKYSSSSSKEVKVLEPRCAT